MSVTIFKWQNFWQSWNTLQHVPSFMTSPLQQTWLLLLNHAKRSFLLLQHRPGPEAWFWAFRHIPMWTALSLIKELSNADVRMASVNARSHSHTLRRQLPSSFSEIKSHLRVKVNWGQRSIENLRHWPFVEMYSSPQTSPCSFLTHRTQSFHAWQARSISSTGTPRFLANGFKFLHVQPYPFISSALDGPE